MIFIVFEFTFVSIAICEILYASSMHETVLKLSLVNPLSWLGQSSISDLAIISELSLVDSPGVAKVILTLSIHVSVNETTLVPAVVKFKSALPSLLAFDKVTSVHISSLIPSLCALPAKFVVYEFSLIERSFLYIIIDTETLEFATFNLTLINISIGKYPPSSAIRLIL